MGEPTNSEGILPCIRCGGAAGTEAFVIKGPQPGAPVETRWRVRCPRCNSVSPHYYRQDVTIGLWNQDNAPPPPPGLQSGLQ